MNRRAELTERLSEALAEPALACAEGRVRDLKFDEVLVVSAHDVAAAARCQAALSAPPEPFVSSPATVARSVGLDSVRRVHRTDNPTEAVRATMASLFESDRWPGDWLKDQPRDVRTLSAARSITWLTRTLETLGVPAFREDHLRRWNHNRDLSWAYPDRGLKLKAKIDLMHPAERVPVLIVANTDEATLARVAFTLVLLLAVEVAPIDEARLVVPSAGEVLSVDPDAMVDEGILAAERAAAGLVARPHQGTTPPVGLAKIPNRFGCARCPFTTCPSRDTGTSDDGPIIRGGIRLPSS